MNLEGSGKAMALRAQRMYPIGEDEEQKDSYVIERVCLWSTWAFLLFVFVLYISIAKGWIKL